MYYQYRETFQTLCIIKMVCKYLVSFSLAVICNFNSADDVQRQQELIVLMSVRVNIQ